MIQQSNAVIQQPNTVIEMENSENDRDGDTENENTNLLNPNEQTDRTPSPTNKEIKTKWIFEIFYGEEHVNGIRQIKKNGSEIQKSSEKFIGTPGGKARRIELMDGEKIQTVTFSGLNYT